MWSCRAHATQMAHCLPLYSFAPAVIRSFSAIEDANVKLALRTGVQRAAQAYPRGWWGEKWESRRTFSIYGITDSAA
jgi:hypothetical protein